MRDARGRAMHTRANSHREYSLVRLFVFRFGRVLECALELVAVRLGFLARLRNVSGVFGLARHRIVLFRLEFTHHIALSVPYVSP